jgi:hypothetical protein
MFVQRMGFTAEQTVALIGGAHSVANIHRRNTPELSSGSMDSTPSRMDNLYFRQLLSNQQGVARVPTDSSMAADARFRPFIEKFANNERAFLDTFKVTFERMIRLGFTAISPNPANLLGFVPPPPPQTKYDGKPPVFPAPTNVLYSAPSNPAHPSGPAPTNVVDGKQHGQQQSGVTNALNPLVRDNDANTPAIDDAQNSAETTAISFFALLPALFSVALI